MRLHSPSVTLGLAEVVPSLVLSQVLQYQLVLMLVQGRVQQRVVVIPARNGEVQPEWVVPEASSQRQTVDGSLQMPMPPLT